MLLRLLDTKPPSLTGRPNGGERIVGAKRDLRVDLGKRGSAIQAVEMANGFKADRFREQPVAARLAAKDFGARLGLRGQSVFLQRFHSPILSGLESAIVSFGGGRENLDDQRRIQERIVLIICKLGISANDNDVGIGVKTVGETRRRRSFGTTEQGRLLSPMPNSRVRLPMI